MIVYLAIHEWEDTYGKDFMILSACKEKEEANIILQGDASKNGFLNNDKYYIETMSVKEKNRGERICLKN